jgi:hypothetical protein
MKKYSPLHLGFKLFFTVSVITGGMILLFSLAGHFISPGNLIPYCMSGGTIGIFFSCYYLVRRNHIKKEDVIAVSVASLIAFDAISLIVVFNFNKPILIFPSFLLIGLTTAASNWYFGTKKIMSHSKTFGVLGIFLILPAFYFIISSILKFKFGINGPFDPIEHLLGLTNGQANFNAVSPFVFGGGLLLAFIINLFAQFRLTKSTSSTPSFKIIGKGFHPLNLIVVLISCSLSSILLTYLLLENN